MEDLSLRTEFHRALDAVAPPAPWLAANVRQELRRRREATRTAPRRRSGFALILTPTSARLIGVALIVILAAAAVAVSLAIHQYVRRPIPVVPHTGAVSRSCGTGGVYMVDPSVGWQGTQRTTDGGKTWRDVSPPPPAGTLGKGGGGTACALDANHAWVAVGIGSTPFQPDHLVVLSTRDGGQSWQQGGAVPIGFPMSWRINFSVEMDFLDDQHGWLLMEYASSPMVRKLYATSDAGAHWALVSRTAGLGLGPFTVGCSESGIMFVTLQRGWLTWDCSSGYGDQPPLGGAVVSVTNDGGQTWAKLNLDLYPTAGICTATPPIFTRSQGILQVRCSGNGAGGWAALYSSSDSGQAWIAHVLSVWAGVDVVDGTTAFYFAHDGQSNTLYRTIDGGAHWTVVAAGLFPGNTAGGLTFIDEKTGFASVDGSPAPWWTHDGGKTWSLPGPYRSVGSTVCSLFSDPGAGNALVGLKMVSSTTGWAAGTRRTTDGGATWSKVSPPAPKDRSTGYSEFFLDATHAWVADAVGSSTACADQLVVYSTADGGATWHQETRTAVQLPADVKLRGTWQPLVNFFDANHGWLTIQETGSMGIGLLGSLYATSDGGRHWTLLPTPSSPDASCRVFGAPRFTSPVTGWMGMACSSQTASSPLRFLVTHDGGATWTMKTVTENFCCSNQLPGFFDDAHAWVLDANTPLLLMTADGGQTWTRHGLPRFHYFSCQGKFGPTTCPDEGIITASFITPNEGWIALYYTPDQGARNYVQIHHTVNGGKTWSIVNSNLMGVNPTQAPEQVTFVDQRNGFVWTGTALLRTTDGGHTWTAVHMKYSQ